MTQRGADPGSDREHRGNAGDDRQFQRTPGRGPLLDLLANRRRHREHAGIAAGYQRNIGTRRRGFERSACPRAFLTIVGGMAALSSTRRRALEGSAGSDGGVTARPLTGDSGPMSCTCTTPPEATPSLKLGLHWTRAVSPLGRSTSSCCRRPLDSASTASASNGAWSVGVRAARAPGR